MVGPLALYKSTFNVLVKYKVDIIISSIVTYLCHNTAYEIRGLWFFASFRKTTQELQYLFFLSREVRIFFPETLDYMTKTLNQIIDCNLPLP
jgi:hypothetical protein